MCFTLSSPGTNIAKGAKLLSARHVNLDSKADLHKVPVTTKRIWMRVADPSSSRRRLSAMSRETLEFFLYISSREWRPRPLRLPRLSLVASAADAFGKGNVCGVGGWLRLPSGTMRWFSQRFTVQDFTALGIPVQADANLDISSYETLAQCFVLLCFWRCLGGGRLALQLPALSDNSGAESVCNKLYTSKVPLNLFVRTLAMWSSLTGIRLECSHIAGEKNEEPHFAMSDRFAVSLQEFWNIKFQVQVFPSDQHLLWPLPSAHMLGPTMKQSRERR